MGRDRACGGCFLFFSIISFGTEAISRDVLLSFRITAGPGQVPIWVYDAWHASLILRQCIVPLQATEQTCDWTPTVHRVIMLSWSEMYLLKGCSAC